MIGTFLYGKSISTAKWLSLIPVIGGVCLASVKELDFAWAALIAACTANVFAAFKGNENKKLMDTPGLRERIGSVGNQFALTSIIGTLFSLPLMIAREGHKWGGFVELLKENADVRRAIRRNSGAILAQFGAILAQFWRNSGAIL